MRLKTQSTLTSKGQITLPIELRRRWDLKPGDRLDFSLEADGRVVVRKWLRSPAFDSEIPADIGHDVQK
jgi:AbrB family looped-hinge helix DNA binding protein